MHTQYLTGESFHSPLPKPQAMCSPQQTEHDLPFSCSLWHMGVCACTDVPQDACVCARDHARLCLCTNIARGTIERGGSGENMGREDKNNEGQRKTGAR